MLKYRKILRLDSDFNDLKRSDVDQLCHALEIGRGKSQAFNANCSSTNQYSILQDHCFKQSAMVRYQPSESFFSSSHCHVTSPSDSFGNLGSTFDSGLSFHTQHKHAYINYFFIALPSPSVYSFALLSAVIHNGFVMPLT